MHISIFKFSIGPRVFRAFQPFLAHVLLLPDDISTCLAAPGRHFDLSCCSGTTFRPFLPLSCCSCCSRTTFRPVLLPPDDISTCPAAPGRHFDLSCCPRTTFRLVLLLRDDISTLPASVLLLLLLLDDISHFDLSRQNHRQDLIVSLCSILCSKLVIDMHTSCSTKLHVHKTSPQSCGVSTLVYIYIYMFT